MLVSYKRVKWQWKGWSNLTWRVKQFTQASPFNVCVTLLNEENFVDIELKILYLDMVTLLIIAHAFASWWWWWQRRRSLTPLNTFVPKPNLANHCVKWILIATRTPERIYKCPLYIWASYSSYDKHYNARTFTIEEEHLLSLWTVKREFSCAF